MKDPSCFGPPPKTVAYHGVAVASDTLGPRSESLSRESSNHHRPGSVSFEEDANKVSALRPPLRSTTTEPHNASVPKPPPRSGPSDVGVVLPARSSKPSLPPRLPPRQGSSASPTQDVTSPAQRGHIGYLNQGALARLGQAGVSVPDLNVGDKISPPISSRRSEPRHTANTQEAVKSTIRADLGANLSRFSHQSTTSTAPGGGTTFAQKQAALRTASSFKTDPSSVSLNDGLAAVSTANNFRERHGKQTAQGLKYANGLNEKFAIASKVNALASHVTPANDQKGATEQPSLMAAKKKPPPPPPKKRELQVAADLETLAVPPPLPLASKPKS